VRAADSGAQHAAGQQGAGSSSSLNVVLPSGQGPAGPSSGGQAPVAPATPAVTDIFDNLTGGSGPTELLLTGSLGCGTFCYGAARAAFGIASTSAATRASTIRNAAAKASASSTVLLPGGPGKVPGQFFNLSGSGGGSGVALIFISLCALLGAKRIRPLDWTQLRLPTEMWPPSAYVPPIESPG
jgi:hypothetical protein